MCKLLHPYSCTHTLWKASDLVHVVYFPISKIFGHHKIYQPYLLFYSSSSPRKNILATALCVPLKMQQFEMLFAESGLGKLRARCQSGACKPLRHAIIFERAHILPCKREEKIVCKFSV